MMLLGNRHDAKEVQQRASLVMWRRFGSFESGTEFTVWVSTIFFCGAKTLERTVPHFDDELLDSHTEERAEDLKHQERIFAVEIPLVDTGKLHLKKPRIAREVRVTLVYFVFL